MLTLLHLNDGTKLQLNFLISKQFSILFTADIFYIPPQYPRRNFAPDKELFLNTETGVNPHFNTF